jgi:hypothetical protein
LQAALLQSQQGPSSYCVHCRYWVRHTSAAWIELLFYALRKRRIGVLLKSAVAQIIWIVAVGVLWGLKPVQTLWAFVLPYIITSAALMFGNW